MAAKDIFGPGPSLEEMLEADPELRARLEKHRARIAKQPTAAEVLGRRNRRIEEAVKRVVARRADEARLEHDQSGAGLEEPPPTTTPGAG